MLTKKETARLAELVELCDRHAGTGAMGHYLDEWRDERDYLWAKDADALDDCNREADAPLPVGD